MQREDSTRCTEQMLLASSEYAAILEVEEMEKFVYLSKNGKWIYELGKPDIWLNKVRRCWGKEQNTCPQEQT